jgi:hypothetical protein
MAAPHFAPVIDGRIESILCALDPPISSLQDAPPAEVQRVQSALLNRFKEYRSKPPVPFSRVVHAALQRIASTHRSSAAPTSSTPPPESNPEPDVVQASSMNASLYATTLKRRRVGSASGGAAKSVTVPPAAGPRADGTGRPDSVLVSDSSIDGGFSLLPCVRPRERYSDVGGLRSMRRDLRELVEYPLMHPELYAHLGVDPPTGVLLYGSSGCGKTLLARAVGGELGVYFRQVIACVVCSSV